MKEGLTTTSKLNYDDFPDSGLWNGKRDGYYGYIIKGQNTKPICHSMIKKMLEENIHADFIFIRSITLKII